MELAWSFFVWSAGICLSVVLVLQLLQVKARNSSRQLPPGPPRWPIVGNLFDLGKAPHRTLAGLVQKYGPVIWLQLGAVNTVVIQSTKASRELFKNHDLTYSGRTITEVMKAGSFDQGSMAIAQYGPYWRKIKRIVVTELSGSKQFNETASMRKRSVDKMIQWIDEEAQAKGRVCLANFVFLANCNLVGNLVLSRDLLDPQCKEGAEFLNAMEGLMIGGGKPNVADFFPILKWLDPQGIRKKMEKDMGHAMQIVSGFVKERIAKPQSGERKERKDLLDVLLEQEDTREDEPDKLLERDMISLILELFMGATETTSSTIEWAMTELLRDSKTMSKVRTELAQVVGENRRINESDIEKLPYLHAVVKETLRLHPPIPFLIPRRAVEDNNFMGYFIPMDTQVFVNAWAIGRDPDSWDDPLSFKPERFLGSDIDYGGQHFELIPFGAGRRRCAGFTMGHTVLHLALGSLLHCFEWELDEPITPENIDMEERLGITLRKNVPLELVPKTRDVFNKK
ncbi:hypothetical protein IFM89_018483 [Coptis chinensis]|uniref:Cytochrome P450 n=1 Tax=Coptis chinensis TaxID=261450 RepID=A0A835MEX7_9MAGN|nr:hypothetical protein IFM89_018483 [Coptis chinensis]